MRRHLRLLARIAPLAAIAITAAACGEGLKQDLGLSKQAPDEFAVVRNAPLSLPPNFNLRPPKPGEVGDGRLEQRDRARALLVSGQGASRAEPEPRPPAYSFLAGRGEQNLGEVADHFLKASADGGIVAAASASRPVGAAGEQALLARLDAQNPDPNIRVRVDQEAKILAADDRTAVEKLMFWRKLAPPGVVVEPQGEAARINENAALGNPVTEGETPEIKVERLSSGFKGIKLF